MHDIETLTDIKIMVDSFYTRIRMDKLLGPIFEERIGDNWQVHLEKMYRFWQTILLSEHIYSGTPFAPHAKMPIDKVHFDRWVELFKENIQSLYSGSVTDEAIARASLMADLFLSKLTYIRTNSSYQHIY